MFRLLAAALALAAFGLSPVRAEGKKEKDKPTTWVREAGDITLTFEMGKDTGKFTIAFGENSCVITSKLKVEKDTVTSEVTDVEVKGDFPVKPKKGDKITFKWVVKDDVATLTELTGTGAEEAKGAVEGEYKKKK